MNKKLIIASILFLIILTGCVTTRMASSYKLSARELETVVPVHFKTDGNFKGQIRFELIETETGKILSYKEFKPAPEGWCILETSETVSGSKLQIASRYIDREGNVSARQPFDFKFNGKYGIISLFNKYVHIHSYGGTELLEYGDNEYENETEKILNYIYKKDPNFKYFEIYKINAGNGETRRSFSFKPTTQDSMGIYLHLSGNKYNEYLSETDDEKIKSLFSKLYYKVGNYYVITDSYKNLPQKDIQYLADFIYWSGNRDNPVFFFKSYRQIPYIITEELYSIFNKYAETKEQKAVLSRFSEHKLFDTVIYRFNNQKDIYSFHENYISLSNNEKKILADFWHIMPEEYKLLTCYATDTRDIYIAFSRLFARGFENDDKSWNRICSQLEQHRTDENSFFSYYNSKTTEWDEEQQGYIYHWTETQYYLNRNLYNLSDEEIELLGIGR